MKASKHRPGCPQGGSLDVLLPRLNLGTSCQEEGHTQTDSGEEHLHVVSFAAASPAQVCDLWGRQAKHICLLGLQSSITLHPLSLELASWDPSFTSDTRTQDLRKAHQAPLFIECPQCIGLKPNAELDYCAWPVGSHFKQITRQIEANYVEEIYTRERLVLERGNQSEPVTLGA